MDFGSLFGLDLLGDGGKGGGSSMDLGGESEFQDILNLSLQENGISEEVVHQQHIVSTLYIYQALRSRPFFLAGAGADQRGGSGSDSGSTKRKYNIIELPRYYRISQKM